MTKLLKFDKTDMTCRMIYNFTGFSEVSIFPLYVVMASLRGHFLSHGFQICIFCGTYNRLTTCEVQCCRLSGSSFTEGIEKHNDDVIMTSFHISEIRNLHILRN